MSFIFNSTCFIPTRYYIEGTSLNLKLKPTYYSTYLRLCESTLATSSVQNRSSTTRLLYYSSIPPENASSRRLSNADCRERNLDPIAALFRHPVLLHELDLFIPILDAFKFLNESD